MIMSIEDYKSESFVSTNMFISVVLILITHKFLKYRKIYCFTKIVFLLLCHHKITVLHLKNAIKFIKLKYCIIITVIFLYSASITVT